MKLGKLTFHPLKGTSNLTSATVIKTLEENDLASYVSVAEIDPDKSDTAVFCEYYDIEPGVTANCVIVEAKRADRVWLAACLVPANTRADVNGAIRKYLDARKISFASMETAVSMSRMEYGAITPIGLPIEWPLLVDSSIYQIEQVLIGSGLRGSKLLVNTEIFRLLPVVTKLKITK